MSKLAFFLLVPAVIVASGCAVRAAPRGVVVRPAGVRVVAPRPAAVAVRPPPPAPAVVVARPPRPAAGYVWRGGHYVWRGGRYAWVGVAWVVPPRGKRVWVPGRWRGGRWIGGTWS